MSHMSGKQVITSLIALAALGAPAAAGADQPEAGASTLTPAVIPPKITGSNAPLTEGFTRTFIVSHTCRAKICFIDISARPGTALVNADYLFRGPRSFRYRQGVRFALPFSVAATHDGVAEPREAFIFSAKVRTRDDGAADQRAEEKKLVEIIDRPF
ncbi:MAG: hypothetical protein H0V29_05155 [Thermoleophilaceae bacterium]|nr:hypothetical protein [Thermoleophilaceae bacterium]